MLYRQAHFFCFLFQNAFFQLYVSQTFQSQSYFDKYKSSMKHTPCDLWCIELKVFRKSSNAGWKSELSFSNSVSTLWHWTLEMNCLIVKLTNLCLLCLQGKMIKSVFLWKSHSDSQFSSRSLMTHWVLILRSGNTCSTGVIWWLSQLRCSGTMVCTMTTADCSNGTLSGNMTTVRTLRNVGHNYCWLRPSD